MNRGIVWWFERKYLPLQRNGNKTNIQISPCMVIDGSGTSDADGAGGDGAETTEIPQDGVRWKL